MTPGSPRWRPTARTERLRQRAEALATARAFFANRGVLELETPAIVSCPVSDPQLANVRCRLAVEPQTEFYLHTSPEYHLKRALAAGVGDVYQIGKVFRDGEIGPRHLPEFTLVEWYRCGVDYGAFQEETLAFIAAIASSLRAAVPEARRIAYRDAFLEFAGCDPLIATLPALREAALRLRGSGLSGDLAASLGEDRDAWLDLLLVEAVEPGLAQLGLVVMDRYPASQAALARLDSADPRVAERFEIYLDGIELANGYHELADAGEQRARFRMDVARRVRLGAGAVPIDEPFLAALEAGLPDCCGVALGFDRLLMALLKERDIRGVVGFTTPESP